MRNWKEIAKLFVIGVKDFKYTKELQSFLTEFPVSGVALFNSPFDSPDNVWKDRQASLEAVFEFSQKILDRVHFISADQEGGRVRRLRGPFLNLPPAQAIADRCSRPDDQMRIFQLYKLAARQLATAGVGLNFAPVCDLHTTHSNNVVGDRSFGSKTSTVIEWCTRFCEAFREEKVATTLKHFPGHGPSRLDSHEQAALIEKSLKEYLAEDVEIFLKLSAHADLLMTGHLSFPNDPERILSIDNQLLGQFLSRLPRQLPLITDDLLSMKAVSEKKPWLRAFEGPYSFILLCGDLDKIFGAIEETIRHAEKTVPSFTEQQNLEERIKCSQEMFHTKWRKQTFDSWKTKIEECENEGKQLLKSLQLIDYA